MFERFIWRLRWVIVIGVLANLISAVGLVLIAGMDFLHLIHLFFDAAMSDHFTLEERNELILVVIELVDGFLMAGVLFIFGFGLYELFISELDIGKEDETKGKILNITSIDGLKSKLGNLIVMILVVKFFYFSVNLEIKDIQSLLYFAISVALVSLALYLGHKKH